MTDPKPPQREPEPSFGPDEEGDVPLRKHGVVSDSDSWVHVDKQKAAPPSRDQ